jgi:hypothetical protein
MISVGRSQTSEQSIMSGNQLEVTGYQKYLCRYHHAPSPITQSLAQSYNLYSQNISSKFGVWLLKKVQAIMSPQDVEPIGHWDDEESRDR